VTVGGPWARELLALPLVQPDPLSCGAATLVVATALVDDGYAELLVRGTHPRTGFVAVGASPLERFEGETLAMHRRVTGPVAAAGRLQLPYPRRLGTPPWAVAHQLSSSGRRYVVRLALLDRARVLADMRAVLTTGAPVAVYLGSRWLPRHVVLAMDAAGDGFRCYDPASGAVGVTSAAGFESGRLPGRWPRPWMVVRPRLEGTAAGG
jgi:hypothetical protein